LNHIPKGYTLLDIEMGTGCNSNVPWNYLAYKMADSNSGVILDYIDPAWDYNIKEGY